jgi:hypothetical protein
MEQVLYWLTIFGQFVVTKLPPEYVADLQRTLPAWTIGLGAAVILAFILKVVTSLVFKIILFGTLIVLFFILLSEFNIPVLDLLANISR